MKTPEITLTEWTSGEIKFDFGRGSKTFTREQFELVCDIVKRGVIVDMYIRIQDANGEGWDVPIKTFSDETSMNKAARDLEKYYVRDQFCAQIAVQFHNVDEISAWAKGELEGKNGIPVQKIPPVDPWMRPVHR